MKGAEPGVRSASGTQAPNLVWVKGLLREDLACAPEGGDCTGAPNCLGLEESNPGTSQNPRK